MTEPKQLTPKQMYYAIQEDRMSSADFEAWLDSVKIAALDGDQSGNYDYSNYFDSCGDPYCDFCGGGY